jgi:hypothetical protein
LGQPSTKFPSPERAAEFFAFPHLGDKLFSASLALKKPQLIRPLVRALHPYVYGEQPKIKGLIKLNASENPPSPRVMWQPNSL